MSLFCPIKRSASVGRFEPGTLHHERALTCESFDLTPFANLSLDVVSSWLAFSRHLVCTNRKCEQGMHSTVCLLVLVLRCA